MKKSTQLKKLNLNKKTIQFLTKSSMYTLNGGGSFGCTAQDDTFTSLCQTDPEATCLGLTPQTLCIGGTTVTISACNTGGGGGGTSKTRN